MPGGVREPPPEAPGGSMRASESTADDGPATKLPPSWLPATDDTAAAYSAAAPAWGTAPAPGGSGAPPRYRSSGAGSIPPPAAALLPGAPGGVPPPTPAGPPGGVLPPPNCCCRPPCAQCKDGWPPGGVPGGLPPWIGNSLIAPAPGPAHFLSRQLSCTANWSERGSIAAARVSRRRADNNNPLPTAALPARSSVARVRLAPTNSWSELPVPFFLIRSLWGLHGSENRGFWL